MPLDTAERTRTSFKQVGTRPLRPDGIDKVTGRAAYAADTTMPGMIWGKVLRSPHPNARIVSIDTSAARAMPGVRAVVTGEDTAKRKWGAFRPDLYPLAIGRVRYVGDEVAAVAATDPETARAAVDRDLHTDDGAIVHLVLERTVVDLGLQLAHAWTFDVKAADGRTGAQQLARGVVVLGVRAPHRVVVVVRVPPSPFPQVGDAVLDHGQAAVAEHVDLHQAEILGAIFFPGDGGHRAGRCRCIRITDAFGCRMHRHDGRQRTRGDDHAAAVHAQVAGRAGDALGGGDDVWPRLGQRLAMQAVAIDAITLQIRQPLAHRADRVVAQTVGACGFAQGTVAVQVQVGRHQSDVIYAEISKDRAEHRVAFIPGEVDVDIRRVDAFRGQEAFEHQSRSDGIDVGDAERVGDQRSRARTTTRSHRHAILPRPADEISHDEEVAGKSHLLDHAELVFEPALVFRHR